MKRIKKITIITVSCLVAILILYGVFFGFSSNKTLNKKFNSTVSTKAVEIDHLDTLIVDINERIKILNTKLDNIDKKQERQGFLLTVLLVLAIINVFIAITFLLMKTYLKATLSKVSRYEDSRFPTNKASDEKSSQTKSSSKDDSTTK